MRLFGTFILICLICLIFGCAQRSKLGANHGLAHQQIFYRQGSAPPVKLAPTTSEDAKRISESRARRSGSQNKLGRSQAFGFGGGSSGSIIE